MGIKSVPNINNLQKTIGSTFSAAATTCVLNADVSGYFASVSSTNPGVFVVDRIDANGVATPTKREYCTFTGVSTTTLTGVTKNADASGTDQDHAVGAIVEFVPDVLWAQSIQDTFDVEHDGDGTHDTTKVVDLTTAQTLTNKTLTSPKINENVAVTSTATELNRLTGVTSSLVTAATTDIFTNKTLVQKVTAYTPAGAGTTTIDLTTGNIHTVTMPANTQTLAISNEATGQCFLVEINNVTSQGALTWFTTIRWSGGTAPTLTGTNGKRDVFGFRVTGADTYDGFIVGQNL